MKEINWNTLSQCYNNILRDYIENKVKANEVIDYFEAKEYVIENCLIKYHYIGKRQNTYLFKIKFDVLFLSKFNYFMGRFDKSFIPLTTQEIEKKYIGTNIL